MRLLFIIAVLTISACSSTKLTEKEKFELRKEQQRLRIQKDRN